MIKSMLLYRITRESDVLKLNDYHALNEALQLKPEALPTGSQWSKTGFAALDPEINEDLVWAAPGDMHVINYMIHERALTAATIREYLIERVKRLEDREGRKAYKKEYAQLKDEVIAELLPKAFIKHKRVIVMVIGDLLVIGATTAKVAENVLCDLRECLDGLSVVPYSTKLPPAQWLGDLTMYKKGALSAGDTAKLVNEIKDTVTFKGVDLSADEPQTYRDTGFVVKELGMWFGADLYCKVTDTLIFKGMKFAEDLVRQRHADDDGDPGAMIDADIMLISDVIKRLVAEIGKQIGEEVPKMKIGQASDSSEPSGHLEDIVDDTPAKKLLRLQEEFATPVDMGDFEDM